MSVLRIMRVFRFNLRVFFNVQFLFFIKHFLIQLNYLVWHWLIKLDRRQGYNSVRPLGYTIRIHHLYIVCLPPHVIICVFEFKVWTFLSIFIGHFLFVYNFSLPIFLLGYLFNYKQLLCTRQCDSSENVALNILWGQDTLILTSIDFISILVLKMLN